MIIVWEKSEWGEVEQMNKEYNYVRDDKQTK